MAGDPGCVRETRSCHSPRMGPNPQEMNMTALAAQVAHADRMMLRAAALEKGLQVAFADGRAGLIPFSEVPEIADLSRLASVELPDPYEIHLRNVEGETVELPWDFARHFCDPSYQERVEGIAARGRRAIGRRIRILRESRGVTQDDLAHAAGIGRVTLVRIETGQRSPRYETLARLAIALNVEPAELLV